MGEVDYNDRLFPVYEMATKISNLLNLGFSFKVDHQQETALIFNLESGKCRPRLQSEPWPRHPEIQIVPDICDYTNKIIIEFEEETGNRKPGAKDADKGHHHKDDLPKERDIRRNDCYKGAGFALHQVWASNFKKSSAWSIALTEFLIEQWRKKCNSNIKAYEEIPDLETRN